MTQLSVRQYLDINFVGVSNYDCRLISAHARSYCVKRKIQFGRARLHQKGKRYSNLYDVEILEKICSNHVGLRRKY